MTPTPTYILARRYYQFTLAAVLTGIASFYYVTNANAAAPAATPPAPAVDVVVVQPQEIRSWANFSGRLAPVESATIKPLVSGTIQQVLFKDGQVVKKGQQLFVIDPRPHQASVQRAQAQLATAQSRAKLASDELKRAQQLINAKLVSQSIYESALSSDQVAQAAVKEAEAALSQAKLNLEYAHISAPINGRISRAELTVGNVVEAGPNAPQLAQIVANDKLYAEFNVDESTYIQFVRNNKDAEKMPVELTLSSESSAGSPNVYKGYITSFDNRLDTTSGTIRARAVFDNNDGALTAGMFANVRLGSAEKVSALLVPERAIGTNQSKKFVLVVDDKNVANYQEITLGNHYEGQRVILSGLTAGSKIIVNGLSHVRPNSVVNPSVEKAPAQVALNP